MSQTLLEQVVAQIQRDIEDGNFDALDELLSSLPEDVLRAYLPEQ